MADISDILKNTYAFLQEKNVHVFRIFPNIEQKVIQAYTKDMRDILILDRLRLFFAKNFPDYKVYAKNLNTLDEYLDKMCASSLAKRGFSKYDVSNPLFERIGLKLRKSLNPYGRIYNDVYFENNNKEITKIDFVLRTNKGSALFAAQTITGENCDKNIRRKLRKLNNANSFMNHFFNANPWMFRTLIKNNKLEYFKVYKDYCEFPYVLNKIISCTEYFG